MCAVRLSNKITKVQPLHYLITMITIINLIKFKASKASNGMLEKYLAIYENFISFLLDCFWVQPKQIS